MVKIDRSDNHLIIQHYWLIYMSIYYAFMGLGCYFMIQDPDVTLGLLLVVMIPVGLLLGRPLRLTFIYDRLNRRLFRKSNWINFFTSRYEEAPSPVKWIIEVEDASSEGPDYYANILLDNGHKFLFSKRLKDVDILASYVSQWEDVEVFYYNYELFGGREPTFHRLYRKKEQDPNPEHG